MNQEMDIHGCNFKRELYTNKLQTNSQTNSTDTMFIINVIKDTVKRFTHCQLQKQQDWKQLNKAECKQLYVYNIRKYLSTRLYRSGTTGSGNIIPMLWDCLIKLCQRLKTRMVANGSPTQKDQKWRVNVLGQEPLLDSAGETAIQGHPESPWLSKKNIKIFLTKISLNSTTHDPCIYLEVTKNEKEIIIMSQVDDIVISVLDMSLLNEIIKEIGRYMKDPIHVDGILKLFNGLDVEETTVSSLHTYLQLNLF